jgi:hypothetical protein
MIHCVAFGATSLEGERHPGTGKDGSPRYLDKYIAHPHFCKAAKELHHG